MHVIVLYVTLVVIALQDSFNISEGIDGSVLSYAISYSDSVSGISCGSTIISASSCDHGKCSDVFEVSTSLCPPLVDIIVTVLATNVFGNGPTSMCPKVGKGGENI